MYCVRLTLAVLWLSLALAAQTPPPSTQSAVPALPPDIPANADQFSVLMMGNAAGQQASWKSPDGTLHVFFQFNDRGRGPKTTAHLKMGTNGIPVQETIEGNEYF